MSRLFLANAVTQAIETGDYERVRELWSEMETWLSGELQMFTPTLTATTTDPTLGSNPTQTGQYQVLAGNLVIGWFSIVFGTGMTAGSGNYEIALPFNRADLTGGNVVLGTGRVYDASVGGSFICTVEGYAAAPTPNIVRMVNDTRTTSGSVISNSTPFTWVATDEIHGNFMYIAEELTI